MTVTPARTSRSIPNGHVRQGRSAASRHQWPRSSFSNGLERDIRKRAADSPEGRGQAAELMHENTSWQHHADPAALRSVTPALV